VNPYLRQRELLVRMEAARRQTEHHLVRLHAEIERRAEASVIRIRTKRRQYGRHATTWTPADEREYERQLALGREGRASEVEALSRKLRRQAGAIVGFRARHGFNAP
jgi:translation initiation factor 1 (eIF-1/SUI1)